jgi:DNA-binding CsgD family transcriptional regulator
MAVATDPGQDAIAPVAPRSADPGAAAHGTGTPSAVGTGRSPRAGRTSSMTVGRDAELRRLRDSLARPPALVLIEGEAGMGKTRLVRELLAHADLAGTARLLGRSTRLRKPLPFGPVVDALAGAAHLLPGPAELSPVTAALRPLLPELAARLPPPLEPVGNRRQERHRIFRGFRDLLAGLGPAVLVLEDVHWADADTEELLRFLVGRLPERLGLALTYRPEDLADPTAPVLATPPAADVTYLHVALRPLEAADVARLAHAAGLRLDRQAAERLYERTGGVPLAVEETIAQLRDLSSANGRPIAAALAELPVPPSLHSQVRERVSRLGAAARRLAQAAAVLSGPASESLLTRVAGLSPSQATAGLVELVRRSVVRPDDRQRYAFRHALAQQAVRESVAEPVRQHLHRRAVQAMRALDPPPLDQLAYHCKAAGLTADWLRYAEAAADHALARGDDAAAAQVLHDVVTCPEAGPETRARLAFKLGRAALTGTGYAAALSALRSVLADSLPAPVRGLLRLCLGLLLRTRADSAGDGWTELEQAVTELECPGATALAMAGLGLPYLPDGAHVDDHLRWLAQADRAAADGADPAVVELVRGIHAGALVSVGDPAGWWMVGPVPDAAPPPDATRSTQRCLLTVYLAWSATCVGHHRVAETLLEAARQTCPGTGGDQLSRCLAGVGLLHDYAVGRWDGLAERAAAAGQSTPDVDVLASGARLVCGLLWLATGELRTAAAHLEAVEGPVPMAVSAAAGRARLAVLTGDVAAAVRWIRQAVTLVRQKGVWCWAADLVPTAVAVLARDPRTRSEARSLLDEFTAGVSGRDSPLAQVAVTAARAALAEAEGDHRTGAHLYGVAARGYAAVPRPYDSAAAWESRGRCLLAAGKDGTPEITEAMTVFERLSATRDVARCRHLLRSLGRRLPHHRGRRGYGDMLSPREREVVRLVRNGLTNREIAEALFLSSRTVEAHVARALRKLGVGSRRELAGREAVATRDGAPPDA